jgi:hypothetical protein
MTHPQRIGQGPCLIEPRSGFDPRTDLALTLPFGPGCVNSELRHPCPEAR